jgi:hypothetical protein
MAAAAARIAAPASVQRFRLGRPLPGNEPKVPCVVATQFRAHEARLPSLTGLFEPAGALLRATGIDTAARPRASVDTCTVEGAIRGVPSRGHVQSSLPLPARLAARAARDWRGREGEAVGLRLDPARIHVFDRATGLRRPCGA